jgi:DNA-binding transcriptional regulator LsrR (DeoR family)
MSSKTGQLSSKTAILPERNGDRNVGRVARNRMRIAWMYYVEGLTQNEIADRLGIGRVTVVRNINEAIRQREVKIWIEGEIADCVSLENELKSAFGLEDAVVVPEPSVPSNVTKAIGVAAGMYTTDQLTDDFVLGVGWGGTLYESLGTLTPRNLSGVEVISLLGGVVEARRYNPAEFAWQFANIVGADCYLLTAPALVDSPATREALIERCGLSTVFTHGEKMDMALLSVGTMEKESTSFKFGFLSEEERTSLIRRGAVGDLLYNFFDQNGKIVDHPVNARVMSMPVSKLRNVPKRVIASGGVEKIQALLGAIKLVSCNVLITDEKTAQALIAARSNASAA